MRELALCMIFGAMSMQFGMVAKEFFKEEEWEKFLITEDDDISFEEPNIFMVLLVLDCELEEIDLDLTSQYGKLIGLEIGSHIFHEFKRLKGEKLKIFDFNGCKKHGDSRSITDPYNTFSILFSKYHDNIISSDRYCYRFSCGFNILKKAKNNET
jgi:hypothetical protein